MTTAIIALLTLTQINSPENAKVAEAIAYTESLGNYRAVGDGGFAYGAYQMHKVAWEDTNDFRKKNGLSPFPWYNKRYKATQDIMCMSFVELIKHRFKKDYGRLPLPKEIYMAYTMGYEGAKRADFHILNAPEYKQRAILRFMEKYNLVK
jgi:hypothetical protein